MSQEFILYTKELQAAKQEIESFGGRVTQQFTDVLIVANLPGSVDPQSLAKSSSTAPPDLDRVSQIAADAWMSLQNKRELRVPNPGVGLPWDTPGYQSPRKIQKDSGSFSGSIARSTGTPTSLYMIGSIAVGIVIVSGTQPNLNFSDAERQKVIQEVQEGLGFLANAEPRANVSFVYDIQFINVTATPGSTVDNESAEAPWRDAALQQMGFTADRQGSVDYVQQLRQDKGTEWAYVAYFTKYPLHHFAYAGDERICMEYANDGWGPNSINSVFAHETCHIFGAADEYKDSNCVCGGSHGFLGVPNNNCMNCSGTHVPCLMDRNELTICQWTRGQIGWDDQLIGFAQKTPVTALARKSEHIDVFAVNKQGRVCTAWWDGFWHDWGTVGNGIFNQLTPVVAIARRADHIDLFAVGQDGLVYTTWWDGFWHDWGTVGNGIFNQLTPVVAIARRADHIDLFAVGQDGLVYTTWWDGFWHDWGTVGNAVFPQLTPVVAIARRADHIDLFAVGQDGLVYTTWWDGFWHDWGTVGNGIFNQLMPVVAIARRADHIDLFAVGQDGLVYTTWWDGFWHDWGTVGNAVFPQLTPVVAIARRADHIDLFAVGQDGLVYTTWWDGFWHDWGTVGNAVFPQLTPTAAIVRKLDHIDLFAVRQNSVYTTWWDGFWHDWGIVGNSVQVAPTTVITHYIGVIQAGTTTYGAIELVAPAPPEGKIVKFTSSDSTLVRIPNVTVPAARTTATFPIQIADNAANATVTLTATSDFTKQASLSIPARITQTLSLGTKSGFNAHVLGIAANGGHVYAAHYYSKIENANESFGKGELVVIDSTTFKEVPNTRIPMSYQPRSVAVNPLTKRLYVVNRGESNPEPDHQGSSLSIIEINPTDATELKEIARLKLGGGLIDVAVNTQSDRIYATNSPSKNIRVINGATNQELQSIQLPSRPVGITVDEKTNTLYVAMLDRIANPIVNAIAVVKITGETGDRTQTQIETIPIYEDPDNPDPTRPTQPVDVAFNPDLNHLYVANLGGGGIPPCVTVINLATRETTTVKTIAGARAIAVNPQLNQVYIGTDAGVQIMNGVTNSIVSTNPQKVPWGVAVDLTTNQIYAGSATGGTVSQLTAPDLSILTQWT